MSAILTASLSVLGSFAVVGSVIAWSRTHASDLIVAQGFLDDSYKAAQRLIKSSQTPEPVLDFVEWFMERAGSPTLARELAVRLLADSIGAKHAAQTAGSAKFATMVKALPTANAEDFASMVTAGCLASAAADPIFARVYRKALTMTLGQKPNGGPISGDVAKAADVAADIAASHHLAVAA